MHIIPQEPQARNLCKREREFAPTVEKKNPWLLNYAKNKKILNFGYCTDLTAT